MTSSRTVEIKPGRLFIDGQWREAVSGKTFATVNPATGQVITEVAEGDAADVDLAVAAARRAFDDGPWYNRMSAGDREKALWKIGDLIMKYAEELAYLETLDSGKPIAESRMIDIPAAADRFYYYAGWARHLHGETIPVRGSFFTYTLREPVGVVAAITPWNFPLLLAASKIAPALAMGNTVILKPAEQTPLTAIKLAEIIEEAGLPEGVFNLVTGFGPTAGAALVRHPGVDKITFTGETTTGKEIMRAAAETVKHLTLELGGKSPNIVLADADLDQAARGAFLAIFYNAGEVCTAGSRLLVEESIHDALMEKLLDRVKKVSPGDPLDPKTRLGPVVSAEHREKVLRYIELGRQQGARLLMGGEPARVGTLDGYFVEPTVFDDVAPSMTIAQEEIFGPVLATIPVKDVEDAARVANQTIYGLAAGIWTRDVKKAHALARKIKAGTVWVNTYNMYDSAAPYGGYKMSGFGRELGRAALDHYTQTKTVWVDLS